MLCSILLKKVITRRNLWCAMILLPCLIEFPSFVFGQGVAEFSNSDKMLFECTLKESDCVNVEVCKERGKFVVECFPQSVAGINKSLPLSNANSTDVSTNHADNAAKNCTAKGCLNFIHWLKLLSAAIIGGIIPTVIFNVSWYYWTFRKSWYGCLF